MKVSHQSVSLAAVSQILSADRIEWSRVKESTTRHGCATGKLGEAGGRTTHPQFNYGSTTSPL